MGNKNVSITRWMAFRCRKSNGEQSFVFGDDSLGHVGKKLNTRRFIGFFSGYEGKYRNEAIELRGPQSRESSGWALEQRNWIRVQQRRPFGWGNRQAPTQRVAEICLRRHEIARAAIGNQGD